MKKINLVALLIGFVVNLQGSEKFSCHRSVHDRDDRDMKSRNVSTFNQTKVDAFNNVANVAISKHKHSQQNRTKKPRD